MDEAKKQQLCKQLGILDTSLVFLGLLLLSVGLSWRATAVNRKGLCQLLTGKSEQMPDVFGLRLVASAIVVGALTYFFHVTQQGYDQTRGQGGTAERSAGWNLLAAALVLLAAFIRLYDLIYVQCNPADRQAPVQQAQLEEELPV